MEHYTVLVQTVSGVMCGNCSEFTVKHLNVDPPGELYNEQMDPGLEMKQRPVAVSLCLPSSYNSDL